MSVHGHMDDKRKIPMWAMMEKFLQEFVTGTLSGQRDVPYGVARKLDHVKIFLGSSEDG